MKIDCIFKAERSHDECDQLIERMWQSYILQNIDMSFFNASADFNHNGYSLCCLINNTEHINAKGLANELYIHGINTDTHRYKNSIVAAYPFVREYYNSPRYSCIIKKDFPNAAALLNRLLVLPCHEAITESNIIMATEKMSLIVSGE